MTRSAKLGVASALLLGSIFIPPFSNWREPISLASVGVSGVLGLLAAQQGSRWWLVIPSGNPDLARACTSHVERKNGTLRQWCRRLTRLTYAFSKKKENLQAALALHFWYYDFARIHSSLRVTPAMEAGLTNHVWTMQELLTA